MGQFARRFLANYSILVVGDLASKLLLLWASVRMANVLGTGLFGDIAFAIAFTSYFGLLVSQGLGTYGMQEVARRPARVREYVGNILSLRLAASIAAAVVLAGTVSLMQRPPGLRILLLLYGLLFFTSAFQLNWVFQAMEEMKVVAGSAILGQLVFSLCILTRLDSPEQVFWVPVFQFGGEAIATGFLFLTYSRKYGRPRFLFQYRAWSAMWKESLPIGLSFALGMVLYNFDVVLLGFMKPSGEVGQYSAAYRFINFFVAFLALYNTNIFPTIARCRNQHAMLSRISDRSLQYTLAITIPLAVGGMMIAGPLMHLMFGPEYAAGANALRILFWVIPIMASRAVYRATLLSHGFQQDYLWIALTAAAVNTGLNLLLIPRYSFMGAATTTVICEILVLVMVYERVARRIIPLQLRSHVWKPVAASIPMAFFLYWYRGAALPFLIAAGFTIYMLGGWFVGAIRPREVWSELRSASAPAMQAGTESTREGC